MHFCLNDHFFSIISFLRPGGRLCKSFWAFVWSCTTSVYRYLDILTLNLVLVTFFLMITFLHPLSRIISKKFFTSFISRGIYCYYKVFVNVFYVKNETSF